MDTPQELLNGTFSDFVQRASNCDIASDDATKAFQNLELFSKIQPPKAAPEPPSEPRNITALEKVKAGIARVWDNETTRVLIKAGGAFGGVALVTYTTIRKDHVLERQAIAQANQSSH